MLQDTPTTPEADATGRLRPRTSRKDRDHARVLRRRIERGVVLKPAEHAWLRRYEQRPIARAHARRRRARSPLAILAARRAVAAVFEFVDVAAPEMRRDHLDAWQAWIAILVWSGVPTRAVSAAAGLVPQNVLRTADRVATRMHRDRAFARLVRRAEVWSAVEQDDARSGRLLDAVVSARVEPQWRGRPVVVMQIEVDSPLWRAIDQWSEAYEMSPAPSTGLPGAEGGR